MGTASCRHSRQLQLSQPDRGDQVDVEQIGIDLRVCVDGEASLTDACIIDEYVYTPLPVPCLRDLCFQHAEICNFERENQSISGKQISNSL